MANIVNDMKVNKYSVAAIILLLCAFSSILFAYLIYKNILIESDRSFLPLYLIGQIISIAGIIVIGILFYKRKKRIAK